MTAEIGTQTKLYQHIGATFPDRDNCIKVIQEDALVNIWNYIMKYLGVRKQCSNGSRTKEHTEKFSKYGKMLKKISESRWLGV